MEPRNLTDKIVESMSEADTEADTEAETDTDAYVEPKYTHTPETEVEIKTCIEPIYRPTPEAKAINRPIPEAEAEANTYTSEAEQLLEPKPINRPIPSPDRESIYEIPYSTRLYHNYGGTRVSFQNFGNDQPRSKKWSLSCLIIGLLIGLVIGATVTGLSMHFTKTPVCVSLPTASPMVTSSPMVTTSPMVTATPPNTFDQGESNLVSFFENINMYL